MFDKPRFFHLGYDEETYDNQRQYAIAIVRQYELWWKDFLFFVNQVEKRGSRPWIWSDYAWKHGNEFPEKMPKTVLQSNWFYGTRFEPAKVRAVANLFGFGPGGIRPGSNQPRTGAHRKISLLTVDFCRKNISAARLKGFLQTPWKATVERWRQTHLEAIAQVKAVIAATKG